MKFYVRWMRRVALRATWFAGNLRWLAGRGPRTKLHRTPMVAKVACECCPGEPRAATKAVFSPSAGRDVHFCDWCWRRFLRANEKRAIPSGRKPKKRKPTKGAPGGGAA